MNRQDEIQKIITLLAVVWSSYPQLRLGQLLENPTMTRPDGCCCIFYLPDSFWLEYLEGVERDRIGG